MKKCKFLVVDDEHKVQNLYEQRFMDEIDDGLFQIDFAFDGADGLEKVKNNEYEVVFSDINMPGMSGIELLEKIREINSFVSVVMVTAYGDMDNIRHAMNHGASDFLTKPINFDDLEKTLNRCCVSCQTLKSAEKMRYDIQGASVILDSILPQNILQGDGFEILGKSTPARAVGGDFFNFSQMAEGGLYLQIADVCGKGLPAALFVYYVHNVFQILLKKNTSPGELLSSLNYFVGEAAKQNQFVTMIYGQLKGSILTMASAGHCSVLIHRASDGSVEEYNPKGRPLGILEDSEFEDISITLEKDDLAVFYSDGITDAENFQGEFFDDPRLVKSIKSHSKKEIKSMLNYILEDVDDFVNGADQFDDMTLLVLRKL